MINNDITNIPFDKIKERVEKQILVLEKTLLDNIKTAIETSNARKIQELTDEISGNFESSEGIEESVRESINLVDSDVELSADQKNKIRQQAIDIVLGSFIQHFDLGSKHSWLLPHMIAHFGTWKAVRIEGGKYSPKLTYIENTKDNDFNYGLWLVATSPRRELIKTTKDIPVYKLKSYNYLVPLILAGFKQFQNINYNDWERSEIAWLVDKELGMAMLATVPSLTNEDVEAIRSIAHTTKSGKDAGKQKSPITSASLYFLKDFHKYDLTTIPKLAVVMLIQSWLAHPANRSPNVQILDPNDWDNVPKPIVNSTVIGKYEYDWGSTTRPGVYERDSSPW